MDNPRASSGLPQFLVEAGLVSADAIQDVVDGGSDTDRIAQVFVNRGLIADAKLAQVLSYQLCLPWVSLEHVHFSPKLLRLIPPDVAFLFGVVPVHIRRRTTDGRMTLYVATDDPTNKQAEQACAESSGYPVRMMVATPSDISRALAEQYGEGEPPTTRAETMLGSDAGGGEEELAPTQEGSALPKPPPPPRNAPDPDVAAAAARMSSPDLNAYAKAGTPGASSPPPPRVINSGPGIREEKSPVPGLAAAITHVTPRIVPAPEPDDDEIEELDELDDADDVELPPTRRVGAGSPAVASRDDAAFRSSQDLREVQEPAVAAPGEQLASAANSNAEPDPEALFDASSWTPPAPQADGTTPDASPPLPPPPQPDAGQLASAPPPAGLVPPPPPPPASRAGSVPPTQPGETEELEFEPEHPTSSPTVAQAQPPPAAPKKPASTPPQSTLDDDVVLVVGADDEFAYHCARALGDMPARIVRCTLMSAQTKAGGLRPFAILVPGDVYGFDRFSFNKLALGCGAPLVVWESEFEPEQVSALLSIAHTTAKSSQR